MTQNETDLTEQTEDNPEVLEGNAEADRWTNYGKDRVYLNDNDFSGKYDAYIDLQEGEFVCDYSSDFRMEIEEGVATITKHWTEHRHHEENVEHSEAIVRVRLWETEDGEEDATETEDGETETEQTEDKGGETQTQTVSEESAAEEYRWLYEGQRWANYHFDRVDAYTHKVRQGSFGGGIMKHEVGAEPNGDGTYKVSCTCEKFAKTGECSHVHASVARRLNSCLYSDGEGECEVSA